MKKDNKIRIGGLSIERGIMIKANGKTAFAMRLNDGKIHCKVDDELKRGFKIMPILNTLEEDILALTESNYYTTYSKYKALTQIEDKISKAEKAFIKKEREKKPFQSIEAELMISTYLVRGMLLAFFLILVTDVLSSYLNIPLELRPVVEVALKGIFGYFMYMGGVNALNDSLKPYPIYAHHSAEHKVIYCYKNSQELTLENLKNAPSFTKACGTMESAIRFFISPIFYLVLPWPDFASRFLLEIAFYPVVIYISKKIYRYIRSNDNILVDLIIKMPSKYQKLTLREPSDDILMLAKSALEATFNEEIKNETKMNVEESINLENYQKILKKELS